MPGTVGPGKREAGAELWLLAAWRGSGPLYRGGLFYEY